MTPTVRLVKCNALGRPVGEDSPTAVFSDATVARARAMREQGARLTAIANELGCNFRTVSDWCLGKRRPDPVRIVVRRIRPESFVTNHQPNEIFIP
jgi:hypothetical protein